MSTNSTDYSSTDSPSSSSGFSLSVLGGGDTFLWPIILGLLAAAGSLTIATIHSMIQYRRDQQVQKELQEQAKRFEVYKADLEDRQRRLVRFENVQELMQQYKKPLLASAFDLQSRLANQVKQGFLHIFCHQRGSARDKQYARLNFCFVLAEFMGWLEVIRQEIVFIAGQDDSLMLSALVDAIKFCWSGETPIQGVAPRGQSGPEYDEHPHIMQLYAGEIRAIGEVMLQRSTTVETSAGGFSVIDSMNQNLNVMGYAEFVRRMTKRGVPINAKARQQKQWETEERFMQRTLMPLLHAVDQLAALPKGQAPIRRLAMIQVLLCRLIQLLDNAVPWNDGPRWDLEAGEEPLYIPRDFRLTPLVAHLSATQKQWLSSQPFMATADTWVDDPTGEWAGRMTQVDPMYRKLCFCGLRDDLLDAGTSLEREKRAGAEAWPGCFPPRLPRMRPLHWYFERGLEPPMEIWVDPGADYYDDDFDDNGGDLSPDKPPKGGDGGEGGKGGMFASLFGKAGRGSLKKQGSLRKSGSGKLGGMDGKDVDRPTGPRTRVNKGLILMEDKLLVSEGSTHVPRLSTALSLGSGGTPSGPPSLGPTPQSSGVRSKWSAMLSGWGVGSAAASRVNSVTPGLGQGAATDPGYASGRLQTTSSMKSQGSVLVGRSSIDSVNGVSTPTKQSEGGAAGFDQQQQQPRGRARRASTLSSLVPQVMASRQGASGARPMSAVPRPHGTLGHTTSASGAAPHSPGAHDGSRMAAAARAAMAARPRSAYGPRPSYSTGMGGSSAYAGGTGSSGTYAGAGGVHKDPREKKKKGFLAGVLSGITGGGGEGGGDGGDG